MNDQQEHAIRRAERAQRIMGDDFVQEAISKLKSAIRDQVFELPLNATAERERLVMLDKAMHQFLQLFELTMAGGEVAKYELAMEANTSARLEAIRQKARDYAG